MTAVTVVFYRREDEFDQDSNWVPLCQAYMFNGQGTGTWLGKAVEKYTVTNGFQLGVPHNVSGGGGLAAALISELVQKGYSPEILQHDEEPVELDLDYHVYAQWNQPVHVMLGNDEHATVVDRNFNEDDLF